MLRVLSRDGNNLSPTVREAWDSGSLHKLTKNSPAQASDAHVSLIGHITRDELLRYLDRTELGNGFANRILWICAKRSKILPDGGALDVERLSPLTRHLSHAFLLACQVGEIRRGDAARDIWHAVYPELSEGKPGIFGAVTSRAEAQVTRLSCIYALLDESAIVGEVHLKAALAFWEYCEDSARFIFGDSLGDPTADEILRALRVIPDGLTRTDIMALFNRNKAANEIERALQVLLEHGLARFEIEKTEGRSAERWYAP